MKKEKMDAVLYVRVPKSVKKSVVRIAKTQGIDMAHWCRIVIEKALALPDL